ncbi:Rrf2 family transcriptional regulator [Exiguobacterium sp. A1_3_1]|uniref:RrF2 family transcriptional regulator n=1 Tax=Exiguobacterium sp. A1_3_1 TaxID=2651871 RepID=UPI003B876D16
MRINVSTDYAIRTLLFAGAHPSRLVTVKEVAELQLISENHLMKIVWILSKLGFLHTVRGRGGGFKLAKPATLIKVGEVVLQFEKMMHSTDAEQSYMGGYAIPYVMDKAYSLFIDSLQSSTLEDLLRIESQKNDEVEVFETFSS